MEPVDQAVQGYVLRSTDVTVHDLVLPAHVEDVRRVANIREGRPCVGPHRHVRRQARQLAGRAAGKAVDADPDQLPLRLRAIAADADEPGGPRVFLRADKALDYGRVMGIMGELNRAGLRRVALVSVDATDG